MKTFNSAIQSYLIVSELKEDNTVLIVNEDPWSQ